VSRPLRFPNVETLVVTFLQERAELAGTTIVVRLPGNYDGSSAVVVVSRVGGEYSGDDQLDHAVIRIDAYGPDRTAALDLAGRVRGLVWLIPELSPVAGVTITEVTEQRGPSNLRDPAFAAANRYTTRYHLLVRVVPEPA